MIGALTIQRTAVTTESGAEKIETVADAVRIGRESAQRMIATAAILAFGPRTRATESEIHLFTVESVSDLVTAEVPRPVTRPDDEPKE